MPIEDLNSLVRRHMVAVISRNPNKNKAIEKLEGDVEELIMGGMVTLNSKLAGGGVDEEKLAARIVELWGFFWDQVLPYVEGVSTQRMTELSSEMNKSFSDISPSSNRSIPSHPSAEIKPSTITFPFGVFRVRHPDQQRDIQ
jgi:HbrB-like